MKNVSLGPLEQEVMTCVWEKKDCTARDVLNCLSLNKEIAYNTIQTIMSRLVGKGMLRRRLVGKTHKYNPIVSQKNTIQALVSQAMRGLKGNFGDEALIAFVDGLENISQETRKKLIEKLQKNAK